MENYCPSKKRTSHTIGIVIGESRNHLYVKRTKQVLLLETHKMEKLTRLYLVKR
jgi:hypothetical protein